MKWLRLQLLVLMLMLAACSRAAVTPKAAASGTPAITGTPPTFGVTHAPDAEPVMRKFLESLKADDLATMYG
ncbi:MAG TPA: hypothetical protein VF784_04280, partial [Anaerolineales bacterium]